MNVAEINVGSTEIELIRPYVLSFVSLNAFKSNIVTVRLEDGRIGFGEVTALPGYGNETFEAIDAVLKRSVTALQGRDYVHGSAYLKSISDHHPFAASCMGTALDLAYHAYNYRINNDTAIPLLCGIETECELLEIEQQLDVAIRAGYHTVKIKIGKDVYREKALVSEILALPFNFKVRFDANQGYSYADAKVFIAALERSDLSKVELLEQPLSKNRWDQIKDLCAATDIPIMLDESIYRRNEIKLAAEAGCTLIKLKLCKARGIEHLVDLTKYAKSLGLQVVLGNGVATDLANYAEALAYIREDHLFFGAIESNGFSRISKTCLNNFLKIKHGHLVFPATQPDFEAFLSRTHL